MNLNRKVMVRHGLALLMMILLTGLAAAGTLAQGKAPEGAAPPAGGTKPADAAAKAPAPAPAPAAKEAPVAAAAQPADAGKAEKYYFTEKGMKYHVNKECRGLNKGRKHPILESATPPEGKTPCGMCMKGQAEKAAPADKKPADVKAAPDKKPVEEKKEPSAGAAK